MRLLSLFTAALALGTVQAFPLSETHERDISVVPRSLGQSHSHDLAIRGPVRGSSSKGDKNDPVLTKPARRPPKELPDDEKTYKLEMEQQPGRPDFNYQIPSEEKVVAGQSGIHVKEKDGETYVILYYGDAMKYHASHQKYFDAVYKFLNGRGFSLRKHAKLHNLPDNPTTRGATLRGLIKYFPSARDENPPLQWNYLVGAHTVMRVPDGESSMQGTMIQQAARLGGPKAIFMAVDNRSPATSALVAKLLRGPANGPPGYPTPAVITPKVDPNQLLAYTKPVPQSVLARHLRNRGVNTDNPEDLAQVIYYAPLYNLQMSGDNQYFPDVALTKRAALTESLKYRDIIGDIEGQQSNAGSTTDADEAEQIEMWLWAKSVAQANATILLQPFIDAVMNGSANPMAEAQAWNLYSMISPSISLMSTVMGGMDMWDGIAKDYAAQYAANGTSRDAPVDDFTNYAQTIGDFNAFVYQQAVATVNQTGLLQDIQTLDLWLSSTNASNWPAESWEVDDHETDPMMGYLEQMAAYNGFSWDGSQGPAQIAAPSWVTDNVNTTLLLNWLNSNTTSNLNSTSNATWSGNASYKAQPTGRSIVRLA